MALAPRKAVDDRQKIDHVAKIDDASGDGAEMAEEAALRDAVGQPLGGPALEGAEHDRRAGCGEHEGESRGDDKGDHLVLVIAETQAPTASMAPAISQLAK